MPPTPAPSSASAHETSAMRLRLTVLAIVILLAAIWLAMSSGRSTPAVPEGRAACVDEKGLRYSHGAVFLYNGTRVRCENGKPIAVPGS